jgi:hypothetical protein
LIQPYQQQYQQPQNSAQQYQHQQPIWQHHAHGSMPEMGQSVSPANPNISPGELHGQNQVEAAGEQIYESDARDWRGP